MFPLIADIMTSTDMLKVFDNDLLQTNYKPKYLPHPNLLVSIPPHPPSSPVSYVQVFVLGSLALMMIATEVDKSDEQHFDL